MKLGRGNMAKTGAGLPPTLMCESPIKQEKKKDPYSGQTRQELGNAINNWSDKNKERVAAEMVAKSDSANVAKAALILGDSKKMAARKGNQAANVTRSASKIPLVTRGQEPQHGNPGGVQFVKPDRYSRDGQLERDLPGNLTNAWLKSR